VGSAIFHAKVLAIKQASRPCGQLAAEAARFAFLVFRTATTIRSFDKRQNEGSLSQSRMFSSSIIQISDVDRQPVSSRHRSSEVGIAMQVSPGPVLDAHWYDQMYLPIISSITLYQLILQSPVIRSWRRPPSRSISSVK